MCRRSSRRRQGCRCGRRRRVDDDLGFAGRIIGIGEHLQAAPGGRRGDGRPAHAPARVLVEADEPAAVRLLVDDVADPHESAADLGHASPGGARVAGRQRAEAVVGERVVPQSAHAGDQRVAGHERGVDGAFEHVHVVDVAAQGLHVLPVREAARGIVGRAAIAQGVVVFVVGLEGEQPHDVHPAAVTHGDRGTAVAAVAHRDLADHVRRLPRRALGQAAREVDVTAVAVIGVEDEVHVILAVVLGVGRERRMMGIVFRGVHDGVVAEVAVLDFEG